MNTLSHSEEDKKAIDRVLYILNESDLSNPFYIEIDGREVPYHYIDRLIEAANRTERRLEESEKEYFYKEGTIDLD